MKKMQRTQRNRKSSSIKRYLQRRSYGLETLETRNLLAANVLASETGTIDSSSDADSLTLELDLPNAGPTTTATLQLIVTPTDGNFDPAPVSISDASGNPITGVTSDNVNGSLASMTVVDLTEGTYNLTVSDSGTTGGFRLDVSLLGDVESSDNSVSDFEGLRASAALVQAQGNGNFVTQLYYQTRGIDLGVDQYDSGFDVNMDGTVQSAEYDMVLANSSVGSAMVTLSTDGDAPELGNLALSNDTGTSDTDRITTDASLTQDVINEETSIESVLVSIDGGSEVEVRSMLGDTSTAVNIPQSVLESVNGGPLSEGPISVSVRVGDARDNFANAQTIQLTYIDNNQAPTSSGLSDQSVNEDSPFSLDASTAFTDADTGDVLTFTLGTGSPSWLNVSSNGLLSGTPENQNVGSRTVSVIATDSQGSAVTETFEMTVINTNDPPTIATIPTQTAAVDAPFELDIYSFVDDVDATDRVGIEVIVSVDQLIGNDPTPQPLPAWLTFNETTGILSGTPTDNDEGTVTIFVNAVEPLASATATFDINVVDNDPPVVNTPVGDRNIDEDAPFSINLNNFISDPDPGDTIVFSATLVGGGALPGWLGFNGATGVLSGTPDNDDVGSINVEVTATDEAGLSASDQFQITVQNVNDSPVIQDQAFTLVAGSTNGTVVGTIAASDVDVGDTLTFSVIAGDGQAAFAVDSATGEITITDATVAFSQNQFSLTVNVTDGQITSSAIVTLNSGNTDPTANDDPTGFDTQNSSSLTIASTSLTANDTDPENDPLTITGVSATSTEGATVTLSQDGTSINYDPSTSDSLQALAPGSSSTDTFTYNISDGRGGTSSATVSVTVTGAASSSAIVEFTMAFEDTSGSTITTAAPGQDFVLVVSVQDIRADADGVFSAYVDVNYDASLVSLDGTLQHSQTYSAGTSGITTTPGLIDEAGGTDGISPLGGDVFEVFRIQMQAGTNPGSAVFTGDLADDTILHPVTVFLGTEALTADQVLVTGATLTIDGSAAPLGFSESAPGTNPDNMYDVDGNGSVGPLDALMLINELNGGNETYAGILYTDVNGDGVNSPLDALLVIGHLNAGPVQAPLSAAISGEASDPTATDAVYADLGDEVALSPSSYDALETGSSSSDGSEDDEVDEAISGLGNLPF